MELQQPEVLVKLKPSSLCSNLKIDRCLKLLALLLAICPQNDVIAPESAAEHIGEDVSVKMVAESTRLIKDKDLCFFKLQEGSSRF